MAEKFRFFDPVQLEDGSYDREYNAQEFTDYFRALILTGVLRAAGDALIVSANGNNMLTTIGTGIAFIEGRYYENDAPLQLQHDTEALGNNRIDRVVIRLDKNPDKRYVKAFIKKGVPSTSPVPPILTQNTTVYEISLAQVLIVGGQTFIATNAVTDEREYAGSNIIPSFDDNALAQHIADTNKHLQAGERDKINGAVQRNVMHPDLNFRNLGYNNTEKVLYFSAGDWKGGSTSPEMLYIRMPATDFWGSVKVTISSQYANSNAGGSIQATYQVGKVGSTKYVDDMQIDSISQSFARNYKLLPAFYRATDFLIPIVKVPLARNSLAIYLEVFDVQNAVFVNDASFIVDSTLVNNYYPFTPQKSRADEVYDQLFQSVSSGKTLVANAITQMGVPTAANAEFATMANNIKQLRGFATGARTASANGSLSVTGLTFTPKVVVATIGTGEGAGHMYVEKISNAKGYVIGIFDGPVHLPPGSNIELSPVYIRNKSDVIFNATSFNIPVIYAGTYTWYAYG